MFIIGWQKFAATHGIHKLVIANIAILAYNINMPIDDYFKMQVHKKPIAIGKDIFSKMGNAYYIDKTLLVRDIIDSETEVLLFTRPRRFGKTLNMTMLQTFFEKPLDGKDTSHYFKDLKIWQAGKEYTSEQGKRPVISITLKDTKRLSFEATFGEIKNCISEEFSRHSELEHSEKLDNRDKDLFLSLKNGNADETKWGISLKFLSRILEQHYCEKPLILIDEYDAPIQAGFDHNFYDKIVEFMRILLSSVLKTNPSLYKGILTGITRVSKESIFSGLNNIRVNTIFDTDFSEYFGLTQDEVDDLLKFYGISDKREEVAEWYDGYKFGNTEIYNPWSVLYYLDSKCIPQAYWVNTSGNGLMGEMLESLGNEDRDKLISFIEGGTIKRDIDTNIIYPELKRKPGLVYSLLAQTGYLKSIDTKPRTGSFSCELKIPNREILYVYSREIIERYIQHSYSMDKGRSLLEAVIGGDVETITEMLEGYFINCCSSLDLTQEKDYHVFILGLLAAMTDSYTVKSNRESGKDRYDIIMKPKMNRLYLPGIIFEIKHCKPSRSSNPNIKRQQARLEREALKALDQIEETQYAAEMISDGVKDIIRYGAAFTGKDAKVIRRSE